MASALPAKRMFPSPHHYAVIRLNSQAMVNDLGLDDPQTLEEVRAMEHKKYLVYLVWPQELPLPNSRWCRYRVSPIATTLRPEDVEKGITPDMVIPIHPNVQHARGYEPVCATPAFPFDNCFHWIENDMDVRVCAKPEDYDHSRAVKLDTMEHISLGENFMDDFERICEFQENKRASAAEHGDTSSSPPLSAKDITQSLAEGDTELARVYRELVNANDLNTSVPHEDTDSSSLSSSDGSSDGSDVATSSTLATSIGSLPAMDIFGWDRDGTTALVPLVDLWLDLDEHLTAGDIPSPVELRREEQAILSIIKRGLARRQSAGYTNDNEEHYDDVATATNEQPHVHTGGHARGVALKASVPCQNAALNIPATATALCKAGGHRHAKDNLIRRLIHAVWQDVR